MKGGIKKTARPFCAGGQEFNYFLEEMKKVNFGREMAEVCCNFVAKTYKSRIVWRKNRKTEGPT